MEKTSSYTYFGIQSNGSSDRGFVAYEKGIFNPEDITRVLEIQPFKNWAYGDKRVDGSEYLFSRWSAEKSEVGRLDEKLSAEKPLRISKIKFLN